jgi:hypothetical protein
VAGIGPGDEGELAVPEDRSLGRVIEKLRGALSRRTPPKDFSEDAVALMLERQAEFVEELGIEAIRIARRGHEDVVSAWNIAQADQIVRASSVGRLVIVAQSLGGLVGGAGLSQLFVVLAEKQPSTLGYVLATVSTVFGFAALTYGLTRRR